MKLLIETEPSLTWTPMPNKQERARLLFLLSLRAGSGAFTPKTPEIDKYRNAIIEFSSA
jgi:hypothetical protein